MSKGAVSLRFPVDALVILVSRLFRDCAAEGS
jgi:hypothetical protein